MKNFTLKTIFALLLVTLYSCKDTKVLTNYCTIPSKIYNLKSGMSIDDVNTTLGVGPKDVYAVVENKTKVLTYKYKLEYQQVASARKNNEDRLRGGDQRFDDEKTLYCVFDASSNKLLNFISESGRSSASKAIGVSLRFRLK